VNRESLAASTLVPAMIRTNRHLWAPIPFALFALSVMGCYVEAGTQAGPPPPPPQGEVIVESEPPPPPPPEQEVVPASPGPEFLWIGGYHRWDGHRYVWVRGRYDRRPHANARWNTAHWEARGRGHVWVEGRWE
jgi:WXXGXW repeat (2 copies)